MDLNFMVPKIEAYLSDEAKNFTFKIDKVVLPQPEGFFPTEILVSNIQMFDEHGHAVAAIEKIGLEFSYLDLLTGRFFPRTLILHKGHLKLIRGKDGKLNVNFEQQSEDGSAESQVFVAQDLELSLDQFRDDFEGVVRKFKRIKQFKISNFRLDYEDQKLKSHISIPQINGIIEQSGNFLYADLVLDVKINDETTAVEGNLEYDLSADQLIGGFQMTGLRFEKVIAAFGEYEPLKGLILTGDIEGNFMYDLKNHIYDFDLALSKSQGSYENKKYFTKILPISDLALEAAYTDRGSEFKIHSLQLKSDDIMAKASLNAVLKGDVKKLKLQAEVQNVPLSELKHYWPKGLHPPSRDWVTVNIYDGHAKSATLDLDMSFDLKQNEIKVLDHQINGVIDLHQASVDYFNPMIVAHKVDAIAKYDTKKFDIKLSQGQINDIQLKTGQIYITGLDEYDQFIDIDLDLTGNGQKVLELLEKDPLDILGRFDLKSAQVRGLADVNLKLKFPLEFKLTLDDIKYSAKAALKNITIDKFLGHYALSDGTLNLVLDDTSMNIKGTSKFNQTKMDLEWNEYFKDKKELRDVILKGKISPEFIKPYSEEFAELFHGNLESSLGINQEINDRIEIRWNFEMKDAQISIPEINYKKPLSVPGKGAIYMALQKDELEKFDVVATSKDMDINLNAEFWPGKPENRKIKNLLITKFQVGKNNLTGHIKWAKDVGYHVSLIGKSLDIEKFWQDKSKYLQKSTDDEKDAYQVKIAVDKLYFSDDKVLTNLDLFYIERFGYYENIDFKVKGPHEASVTFTLKPLGEGYAVTSFIQNLGLILDTTGTYEEMRDGTFELKGSALKKDHHYKGSFEMRDYRLKGDVPILAKMINVLSLEGIASTLANQGIVFKKSGGDYQYKNDVIGIDDFTTSGSSIGLTANGTVNLRNSEIDLAGTVIPMHFLNKLLGKIPLIGDLFVGKEGEGIFAANYRLTGTLEESKLKINPVSVLAPGILRKILFPDKSGSFDKKLEENEEPLHD